MISSSLVSSNFRNRNYNILLSHYHISWSIGATICATIWFYRALINFSCHLWLSGSDKTTACQQFCIDISQCKIDFSICLRERPVTVPILLPPTTKLGQGYVFTRVCHSVHGGVASVHADTPPPEQTPPTGSSACWEIWATSGRYASYWNAYLLKFVFVYLTQKPP